MWLIISKPKIKYFDEKIQNNILLQFLRKNFDFRKNLNYVQCRPYMPAMDFGIWCVYHEDILRTL